MVQGGQGLRGMSMRLLPQLLVSLDLPFTLHPWR